MKAKNILSEKKEESKGLQNHNQSNNAINLILGKKYLDLSNLRGQAGSE